MKRKSFIALLLALLLKYSVEDINIMSGEEYTALFQIPSTPSEPSGEMRDFPEK